MKIILHLLLLVSLISSCQKATETKEKTYRIAYNVFWDRETDDYEIFSMNPDGSDIRNISNSLGVDWVYSAFGDRIFFISDRDTTHRMYFLYEMDAFGQNVRKISNQRLNDSWIGSRKNGAELIVDPRVLGDSAFHIITRSGDLISKLYTGLAYYNDPAFSPSGEQVVFRGAPKSPNMKHGYIAELYLINADGSHLRQLTQYPEADTLSEWWEYRAGPPFWEANRNVITYNSVQNGIGSLFQINPDGSGLQKITPDSLEVSWHSWSSNGKWLTFDVLSTDTTVRTNYDLYWMDSEFKDIRRLTADTLSQQAPVVVEVSSTE